MGIARDMLRTERRASLANPPDWLYSVFTGGAKSYTGKTVDEHKALDLTTVFACIKILSENTASLPIHLFKRKDKGREKAIKHPLYNTLHLRPNSEMTSMVYRETSAQHLVGWGNWYSNIVRNQRGMITELWPLRPDRMELERKNGKLIYNYTTLGGTAYPLKRENILHIPGLSFNGLQGYSPIAKAREAIGLALATEEFGSRFFGNDARPGIVLKHPQTLKGDARDNLTKSVEKAHQGLENKHKLMILEEGMELQEIGIPPEDAQFLETRKFQVEEICRIFNVPLHMVQHTEKSTSWGTGIDQLTRGFVIYTLRPWLIRIEQSLSAQLLTPEEQQEYYFEHNVDGLLRGDSKNRSEFYRNMFMIGGMSINNILEKENEDPVENGDERFIPLNMQPLSWVSEKPPDNGLPPKEEAPTEVEEKSIEQRAKPPEGRDRIKSIYHRIFVQAAERVVNKETIALKRAIKKHLGQRNLRSFEDWTEEFYKDLPDDIKKSFLQVLRSFAEAIQEDTAEVIGIETGLTAELETFIRSYLDGYSRRHIESSLGQLRKIIQETDPKELSATLDQRADEWAETRANKIADREIRQGGEAIASFVILGAGYRLVWRNRGKSCPYCQEFEGRTVERNGYFVKGNTDIQPEGVDTPLPIYSKKKHPPLHDGCDCFVEPA